MFDALDDFIDAHPGTSAAAKALYTKGFHWHTINTLGTLEARDADPINRFMRVVAIVRELESGTSPPSEWVEKAPSLITGFFMPPNARIAPESVERFIEAYRAFAKTHLVLDTMHPDQSGIGYVITSKMADLFERKGGRTAGVEETLADLERSVPNPAPIRYLRASFYLRRVDHQSPADRQAMHARARQVLASLSAQGSGLYNRKALATLAALEFAEREYSKAREAFRKYAALYPRSSWTWVALVRIGQCEQELGNPREAATAFLEAVKTLGRMGARDLSRHHRNRVHQSRTHESGGPRDDRLFRRDGRTRQGKRELDRQAADELVDHVICDDAILRSRCGYLRRQPRHQSLPACRCGRSSSGPAASASC
jgi:hypothetical protein